MAEERLAGKVAVVTGGSRGIGAAIVVRMTLEGAAVGFTYVNAKEKAESAVKQIESRGGRALAIRCNSADAAAVTSAIEQTANAFGRLDILVNNAGIALIEPLENFSLADFDRTMAINVRAVFVAAQTASRLMGEGGRIITIGSVNADRMPFAGGAVYAASKAAVAGLTRGLARDLGPRGITVNTVQPGPVDTEMNPATGAFSETLKSLMALNRYGHADEIAGLVAYLASREAAFITGACLTIDGGFAA